MKFIDIIIAILMFSLVTMVFFQVVNRFWLHAPAAWTEEMSRYNFVWVSLYGSVRALFTKRHLSVDIVVETVKSERLKKIVDLIASTLVMVFTVIITVTGYRYMVGNWGVDCEFGPFPLVIIYSAVPISGILLFLVSIGQMLMDFRALRGNC